MKLIQNIRLVTLTLLIGLGALAPSTYARSNYCSAPEYRQFDFWVGPWEARDRDNKLLGYQLIQKIERDCILQEWWRPDLAYYR